MKKIYIAVILILIMALTDFLEHPKFGNIEIFSKKSTSVDFQSSLADEDIIEIFNLVMNENLMINKDDIIFCLADHFDNQAGWLGDRTHHKLKFSNELKSQLKKSWKKFEFFDNIDEVLDQNGFNIKEPYQFALTFSTITKTEEKIYIGYEIWTHPLASKGEVMELAKDNGKWKIVQIKDFWIS